MNPGRIIWWSAAMSVCVAGQGTAASPNARDPRFGVMTHFAHGWDPALVSAVARSGIGTVRDELYWRVVEARKGQFEFPEPYVRTMEALERHRVAPLIVLSFESDHYDGGYTPYTDEAIAGYARYAVEVLRRYPRQIQAVEVWNEYNGGFVRGPAEKDRVATYVRTLRAVHEQLKRERPEVSIVGGATAGVPLPYWEKLLAAGALQFMDVLSVHPYRYDTPPEGIETDIAELASLAAAHNAGKRVPIWVSEIGWDLRSSQGPGDLEINELVQAQFLVRAYALLFSAGVERVYWYLFRDYNGAKMGLARDDPAASGKPALQAMETMVAELRDAAFFERDPTPRDVYSVRFRRPDGEDVRVMWSLRPFKVTPESGARIVDMWGRVVSGEGDVELSESPIYVSGRNVAGTNAIPGLAREGCDEVADARKGFSSRQGLNGWSYGFASAESGPFTALPSYGSDDWRSVWHAPYPYLSLSAKEQHPSTASGLPVSVVRRWRSEHHDTVRVRGSFHGGRQGGDGVGVAVLVNGQQRFRKLLGGGAGAPLGESFDFVQAVEPGTTIDFVVDPGPAANIDFDNTAVVASIVKEPR